MKTYSSRSSYCLLLVVAFGVAACAGHLKVAYKQPPADYLPINKTATFLAYTKSQAWDAAKSLCVRSASVAPVHLPSGEEYYVGVETAALANTTFSLETGDAGSLKKVTLGSDPQIDETIQATAQLVESIATAVSTVAPLAAVATPDGAAACPTKVSISLVPIQCVLATVSSDQRGALGCPAPEVIQ